MDKKTIFLFSQIIKKIKTMKRLQGLYGFYI